MINEVDILVHHKDEASNFFSELFPQLTHIFKMTVSVNILKNHYKWGNYDGHVFEKSLNVIYDIIAYWKKNLFMLPTTAGKDFIDEITCLLNAGIQYPMEHITFKVIMVMPSLIPQKSSHNSKGKGHSEAFQRRMILWKSGDLLQLFKEAETIQKGLKESIESIAQPSKKFVEHINKGNIDSGFQIKNTHVKVKLIYIFYWTYTTIHT